MSLRKKRRPKNKKPCARWREAERVASASGDPAMVSGFRMASILSRKYHGHLCPSHPTAGLLLDVRIGNDVFPLHAPVHHRWRRPKDLRTIMLKRASTTRAYFTKSSTSNVVLFD